MQVPRFLNPPNSFHAELKRRVQEYFDQNQVSSTGNWKLYSKAIFLVVAFIAVYVNLVYFTPESTWACVGLCTALGFLTSGIGFNVMHDGGHGSFSKSKWLNNVAAASADLLGASSYMWNIKHNVAHHTFTNIDGIDDDIKAQPLLRMCSTQQYYKIHRMQHIYCIPLYGTLYFFWVFLLDYVKYFKNKVGEMPIPKMKFKDELQFWGSKVFFMTVFVALPILSLGFKTAAIGFLIYAFVTGVVLSVVFQLAHTVEHTDFPLVEGPNIENEWAIHQLETTANFATKNRVISWFVGGLNFQIEHHLFPKISHVHYPAISQIIKQACSEHQVKYVEYPYMITALGSHLRFLRDLGKAA